MSRLLRVIRSLVAIICAVPIGLILGFVVYIVGLLSTCWFVSPLLGSSYGYACAGFFVISMVSCGALTIWVTAIKTKDDLLYCGLAIRKFCTMNSSGLIGAIIASILIVCGLIYGFYH